MGRDVGNGLAPYDRRQGREHAVRGEADQEYLRSPAFRAERDEGTLHAGGTLNDAALYRGATEDRNSGGYGKSFAAAIHLGRGSAVYHETVRDPANVPRQRLLCERHHARRVSYSNVAC